MGATFSISESNNWLDGDYDSSQFVARKYYGKYYNNLNDDINKNNKYVPSKETCKKTYNEKNPVELVSCNCNEFLNKKTDEIQGVIDKNDKDYLEYKKSLLYKHSEDKFKNLNAYIWYFGTNKLKNLKLKDKDKNKLNVLTGDILYNKSRIINYESTYDLFKKMTWLDKALLVLRIIIIGVLLYSSIAYIKSLIQLLKVNNDNHVFINYTISFIIIAIILFFLSFSGYLFTKVINKDTENKIIYYTGEKSDDLDKSLNKLRKYNKEEFGNDTVEHLNVKQCIITEDKELECKTCDEVSNCSNTLYGCCDDGVTTAMDEKKTNCDNNDNVLSYGVIVTLLLIILYPLLYISITTRSVIMYIFSFAIVAILFLLILNIIPLRKETIKFIHDENTTCSTAYTNNNNFQSISLIYPMLILVSFLLYTICGIVFRKSILNNIINNNSFSRYSIISYITALLVIISAILYLIIMSYYIIIYPIIYIILYAIIRYVKIFILKIIFINDTKKNDFIEKKIDFKKLSFYATIYSHPIEYIYYIFKNNKVEFDLEPKLEYKYKKYRKLFQNTELPSGLPWNILGLDIIKSLINLATSNQTEKSFYVPELEDFEFKQFSSNSHLFTMPVSIIRNATNGLNFNNNE